MPVLCDSGNLIFIRVKLLPIQLERSPESDSFFADIDDTFVVDDGGKEWNMQRRK
jgi:hypothetical protein